MIYLEAAGRRHRGSSPLQSLSSLLRDVTALVRSWTSSDGWFQGERPADRPSGVGERASRAGRVTSEVQERELHTGTGVLNCPVLDIAHRRLVQSECRYGAEPRPCSGFLPSLHFVMKN